MKLAMRNDDSILKSYRRLIRRGETVMILRYSLLALNECLDSSHALKKTEMLYRGCEKYFLPYTIWVSLKAE